MPRSDMAGVLHAIAAVELLEPEDIPPRFILDAHLTPALRKTCLAAISKPGERPTAALSALTRAIGAEAAKPWQDIVFMIETGQTADVATHDHYFRIRRSGRRSPLGYLRGLFLALDTLLVDLKETPVRLSGSAIGELGDGLRAALATALGFPELRAEFTPQIARVPARADGAKWRWIRGHQIFAPITQALIFSVQELETACEAGALCEAAQLFATMLRASARSLEFTGDFPTEVYRESIRGSMETPFLPKGFSGVLSADHRRLVHKMRGLRPAMARLTATHPEVHADLVSALAQAYDSHKFVCDRFVGGSASLLMPSECSRSAVEQIERFKQMRLRALQ